ncbi:1,4-alpha-glucan branching protein GlgB [Salinimicrobium oceani]|uniref:1,4-alpha-glucan branching protein GlgB n=1 Tax=Salinimicrobium oceani TaxID=2722702 RepID=UPI003F68E9BF
MAKKKEDKKDIQGKISKSGEAPKTSAGRKPSDKPTASGEVKGPMGVGDTTRNAGEKSETPLGKTSSGNSDASKGTATVKTSETASATPKLPKPKKALPQTGTPDGVSGDTAPSKKKAATKKKPAAKSPTKKTSKPGKFQEPLTDEPVPHVAAPATNVTASPDEDPGKSKRPSREPVAGKKKASPARSKKEDKEIKDQTQEEDRRPAKKMSRQKSVPGISAEEKMKLPNTSPSDDLKRTAKETAEGIKEKLSPDEQTKRDLEQMAKDYVPSAESIKDTAQKIADRFIPDPAKAKEMVEGIIPDKDTIDSVTEKAKKTIEDLASGKTEEQKSSAEKPVEATLLSDFDIHLFKEGKHYHLYNKLGSHVMDYMGTEGVYFAVWAPNAEQVSVIGDFNNWDRGANIMASRWDHSGIWEVFIPGAKKGSLYKYFIKSNNGYEAEKGDPFAFMWETPPNTASVVWDLENTWKDKTWLKNRKKKEQQPQPMSVYELHLGSWKRVPEDNFRSLTYLELAQQLPEYLKEMGFTHVEFMPVMEHPFFGSWGYQITGYFAPSSRFGTPQEFMQLIDSLHQADIGVILDWVPSHFPSDLHGLHYFDGTYLYEHADPRKGFHPDWQSYIFNYGRSEVRSFLISNALFWLDKFHADGLRVDAVASMLYLDYSRKEGEWEPNEFGGRENLEAISFLKEFNEAVYKEFPDAVTIAEESTAWPMVSKPTYLGGLGFGMKWMMGWMHDTLKYFSEDPIHRRYHQNTITFSSNYAFTENFMLPLSHDEVVYGKHSILNKMPGDQWNKFANLRTLYAYMYAHPGTKLLFMGAEFGQPSEWNHDGSLEWHLTNEDPHRKIQETLKELNKLYKKEPALYEKAFSHEGFEWVDIMDAENSIISFMRKAKKPEDNILVVCNFTPVPRENYRIGIEQAGSWKEIFNSDEERFGGSNVKNSEEIGTQDIPAHRQENSLSLTLPPMAVIYLKRT